MRTVSSWSAEPRWQECLIVTIDTAFAGFSVDDIAAAERFYGESLGLAVRGTSRGRGRDIAWFRDPAGNVLSVIATATS